MIFTSHFFSEAKIISDSNKKPNPLVINILSLSFLRNTLTMCLLSSLSKKKFESPCFMSEL